MISSVESNWPRSLLELLALSDGKVQRRVARSGPLREFIEPYQHLLEQMQIIKVAGTNGKGSVCAMLEACLEDDGLRVGLFTSPHLTRITERFRVAGREIALDALDYFAQEVLYAAQRMVARHGEAQAPSFFEALILIAILLFHERGVNVAVFEAGVGGHHDATSVLPGEVSVITTIGLDHQCQLGTSLEAIAADKAGIATAGTHLILGPEISPSLRAIIEEDARAREIAVCQASFEGLRTTLGSLSHPTRIAFNYAGKTMDINLPLLGRHQVSNFATVAEVVRALAQLAVVHRVECLEGVEQTRWAGRLEVRDAPPRIILDAAHNEHGIRALVASLDDLVPYPERILLYGASTGKDYGSCLLHLSHLAPQVFLVEGFYRAEQASAIAAMLPPNCCYIGSFPTPQRSIEFFINNPHSSSRTLIATGSIFMIGELRDCLDMRPSFSSISEPREPDPV